MGVVYGSALKGWGFDGLWATDGLGFKVQGLRRPPNSPLMHPKCPLLRTIRALLKGPLEGPGKVQGFFLNSFFRPQHPLSQPEGGRRRGGLSLRVGVYTAYRASGVYRFGGV